MKKQRILTVLLVVALLTACMAPIALARADTINPILTFSGTTANCSLRVSAGDSDYITMTMRLMHGSIQVGRWSTTGYGYASLVETVSVVKGNTYTLVATVTINGESMPVAAASATC